MQAVHAAAGANLSGTGTAAIASKLSESTAAAQALQANTEPEVSHDVLLTPSSTPSQMMRQTQSHVSQSLQPHSADAVMARLLQDDSKNTSPMTSSLDSPGRGPDAFVGCVFLADQHLSFSMLQRWVCGEPTGDREWQMLDLFIAASMMDSRSVSNCLSAWMFVLEWSKSKIE